MYLVVIWFENYHAKWGDLFTDLLIMIIDAKLLWNQFSDVSMTALFYEVDHFDQTVTICSTMKIHGSMVYCIGFEHEPHVGCH